MTALLNPKVWLALALAAILAFSGLFIYRAGKANVRSQWDAEKLAQQQAATDASEERRMKEKALSFTNEGITRDHIKEKAALAAAARLSDDRLRELQGAIRDTSGGDSAPLGGADDPRNTIIDQCASALNSLDGYAKSVALQAIGLQRFAREVCVTR